MHYRVQRVNLICKKIHAKARDYNQGHFCLGYVIVSLFVWMEVDWPKVCSRVINLINVGVNMETVVLIEGHFQNLPNSGNDLEMRLDYRLFILYLCMCYSFRYELEHSYSKYRE